jgi:hypothetical protein
MNTNGFIGAGIAGGRQHHGRGLSSHLFILRPWIRNVNHYAIIWGVRYARTVLSSFPGARFRSFAMMRRAELG